MLHITSNSHNKTNRYRMTMFTMIKQENLLESIWWMCHSAKWLLTLRPSQLTWIMNLPACCYCLHPPLLKSWHSFCHTNDTTEDRKMSQPRHLCMCSLCSKHHFQKKQSFGHNFHKCKQVYTILARIIRIPGDWKIIKSSITTCMTLCDDETT